MDQALELKIDLKSLDASQVKLDDLAKALIGNESLTIRDNNWLESKRYSKIDWTFAEAFRVYTLYRRIIHREENYREAVEKLFRGQK